MNWRSNNGKSGLIKMLMQEHGVSKRKSEKAVNAVFDLMARALRRGESVELPVGWIRVVRRSAGQKKQAFRTLRNIHTGKIFYKSAVHPKKNLRFRPNPQLIVYGPERPRPTPELLRKMDELEQLFSRLIGREINDSDALRLFDAADRNLDRLLARLRQLTKDGSQIPNFDSLVGTIRQLYWIR